MLFVFLLIIWIILNGRFTLEILWIGCLFSLAMTWFSARFMGYDIKQDVSKLKCFGRFVKFIRTVIVEIVKANITVIPYILTEEQMVEPQLVRFKVDLKHESSQVMLANAITLTPGTITVNVDREKGEFLVHALDSSMADGLNESVFVQELKELEAKL